MSKVPVTFVLEHIEQTVGVDLPADTVILAEDYDSERGNYHKWVLYSSSEIEMRDADLSFGPGDDLLTYAIYHIQRSCGDTAIGEARKGYMVTVDVAAAQYRAWLLLTDRGSYLLVERMERVP